MKTKGFVVMIIMYCFGIGFLIYSLFLPYGYCGVITRYPTHFTVPIKIYGFEAIWLDFLIGLPFLLISLFFTILFTAIKINALRYVSVISGIIGCIWIGIILIYWALVGIRLTCRSYGYDYVYLFSPQFGLIGWAVGIWSWILLCIVNFVLLIKLKKPK